MVILIVTKNKNTANTVIKIPKNEINTFLLIIPY